MAFRSWLEVWVAPHFQPQRKAFFNSLRGPQREKIVGSGLNSWWKGRTRTLDPGIMRRYTCEATHSWSRQDEKGTDWLVTFGCRRSRSRCARGTVSVLPVLISTLPRHFDNAPLPGAFLFLGYQNSADITLRRGYRGPSRHGLSCNPLHRSRAALRAAARLIGLYRGTGNRPVRTEHATVPRLGPQQRTAACTVVEVDARIRRHALTRDMSTVRTGQFGGRDQRRL